MLRQLYRDSAHPCKIETVRTATDDAMLVDLIQTLGWMSGQKRWSPAVIAEQLRGFDDPQVLSLLDEAVGMGLVLKDSTGCDLTQAGWLLAATASFGV